MRDFLTLFNNECRMQFPIARKKRLDILGIILSAFITLAITAVFIYLIAEVAKGYAAVKLNKLNDPYARSLEMLNVIYLLVISAVALLSLEKARRSLTRKEDRFVYLRLPVKPRTIFLNKFSALLLWTFSCSALIVLPVNIIFYIVLSPPPIYWIYTAFVLILLPLVSFSAATICPISSEGRRSRTLPPMVEAQKAQPIRQPTCVEMQRVFPCLQRIKTLSMHSPSYRRNKYLTVPSMAEVSFFSTCGSVYTHRSLKSARRLLGKEDISSKGTPPCKKEKSCAAR
jgi:hypothetical protein